MSTDEKYLLSEQAVRLVQVIHRDKNAHLAEDEKAPGVAQAVVDEFNGVLCTSLDLEELAMLPRPARINTEYWRSQDAWSAKFGTSKSISKIMDLRIEGHIRHGKLPQMDTDFLQPDSCRIIIQRDAIPTYASKTNAATVALVLERGPMGDDTYISVSVNGHVLKFHCLEENSFLLENPSTQTPINTIVSLMVRALRLPVTIQELVEGDQEAMKVSVAHLRGLIFALPESTH